MKKLIITLLVIVYTTLVFCQTTKPILRLNSGMHTNSINKICIDKEGKFILSCSSDKTAKLWDANTGSLIRTIHIPFGDIYDGTLFACALSPDGKTILLGGETKYLEKTYSIYLFDIEQNRVDRKITGFQYSITDIAYSPDGKYVSVAQLKDGARIFETTNWTQMHILSENNLQCRTIVFDKLGRLASGWSDGKIRLYSSNFKLIAETLTVENREPISLAFSPDGELLAAGFYDFHRIQVLNAQNLKLLYEPFSEESQKLFTVSFSYDGNSLIAGGNYYIIDGGVKYMIRVWSKKGKGKFKDFPVAAKTISDIKPVKDNSFVFSSFSPDLGRLGIDGQEYFINKTELNSYNAADKSHLKINSDGTVVEVTPFIRYPLTFSVVNRTYKGNTRMVGKSPTYNTKDINVTNWNSTKEPQINGTPVSFLSRNEKCNCVDISDDGNMIVFGTSWNIICTDSKGSIIWSNPVNSSVWAVNISDNNKMVVACMDDGTIQWYKMGQAEREFKIAGVISGSVAEKSGLQEDDIILGIDNFVPNNFIEYQKYTIEKKVYLFKVLRNNDEKIIHVNKDQDIFGFFYKFYKSNLLFTLYLHPNYQDWVLWTPDGFFDCSNGADRLVGWQVNQSPMDEALCYPASQFFEKFYSPNLGARIITGEKVISSDVTLSSFAMPPLVRITIPLTNSVSTDELLKVIVKTIDQCGGIDEVRLYHNGKLLDGTTRGFKATGQNQEFTVTLIDGENRIKATAFNSQRTESIPDEIIVTYKAIRQVKPDMHILAVGINTYLNPKYSLNFARNDAEAFTQSLQSGAASIFGKVNVTTLSDANATRAGIMAAVDKIRSMAKQEDVFVFYYAGHGVMSTGNETEKPLFYLIPHDVTKMYEADEMLKKLGISVIEIGEFSKNIKAQKQLFVIDACQSGGAMQTLASRGAAEEKAIAQLARSTGTYFIAASGTEQFATEVAELGHGIFTYAVIEALKGSCKAQDGKVTVNLLKSCVEDLVPELSKKHKGQPQFPTGYGFGMDFPIVIVK